MRRCFRLLLVLAVPMQASAAVFRRGLPAAPIPLAASISVGPVRGPALEHLSAIPTTLVPAEIEPKADSAFAVPRAADISETASRQAIAKRALIAQIPQVVSALHRRYINPLPLRSLHSTALQELLKWSLMSHSDKEILFQRLESLSPEGGLGAEFRWRLIPGKGAKILKVDPRSVAAFAGLRPGETIVAVNGTTLLGATHEATKKLFDHLDDQWGRLAVLRRDADGRLYRRGFSLESAYRRRLTDFLVETPALRGKNISRKIERCLRALARSVGDPYTRFLFPDSYQWYREFSLPRNDRGVGLSLSRDPSTRRYVVSAIRFLSPAWLACLKQGDIVSTIDGLPIKDMLFREVYALLHPDNGRRVELTVKSRGLKTRTVGLTSEAFDLTPFSYMKAPGKGYVRLPRFTRDGVAEAARQIRALIGGGAKFLILDLRGNPGGDLEAVVELLGRFLKPGQVAVHDHRRAFQKQWTGAVGAGAGEFADIPLLVLIDKDSASASEVFAGAIQDHGRGFIIGADTYGKGTGQEWIALRNWRGLAFTSLRWFRPNGGSVSGDSAETRGVKPDVNSGTYDSLEIAETIAEALSSQLDMRK